MENPIGSVSVAYLLEIGLVWWLKTMTLETACLPLNVTKFCKFSEVLMVLIIIISWNLGEDQYM